MTCRSKSNFKIFASFNDRFTSAEKAVTTLKKGGEVSDQNLEPFVVVDSDDKPVGTIHDGDAVIFFNFRADRCIEISKAFEFEDFHNFDRVRFPKTRYVGMMQYDGDLHIPENYLVAAPDIKKTCGEYLVHNGIRTFACSETQKFGHVTFFWNGNRSGYFDENLETYLEIPSWPTSKSCVAGRPAQFSHIRTNEKLL